MKLTKGIAIGTLVLGIGFGLVTKASAQRTLVLNCDVQQPSGDDSNQFVSLICHDPTGLCGQGSHKGPIVIHGGELIDADDAPLIWPNVVKFELTCEDPASGEVDLMSFGANPDMAGGVWISKNEACLPYLGGDWNMHVRDADRMETVLTIHNYSAHIINHGKCSNGG